MLALTLVLSLLLATGFTVAHTATRETPEGAATVTVTVESTYKGLRARTWAYKYRQVTRDLHAYARRYHDARRTLMARSSVTEAINLAATIYGNGSLLWALARCESQLNPRAQNASGSSGLLQFMPSTFRSTPFGGFSIWSPYANALAGGWMLKAGRRGEWVC